MPPAVLVVSEFPLGFPGTPQLNKGLRQWEGVLSWQLSILIESGSSAYILIGQDPDLLGFFLNSFIEV